MNRRKLLAMIAATAILPVIPKTVAAEAIPEIVPAIDTARVWFTATDAAGTIITRNAASIADAIMQVMQIHRDDKSSPVVHAPPGKYSLYECPSTGTETAVLWGHHPVIIEGERGVSVNTGVGGKVWF